MTPPALVGRVRHGSWCAALRCSRRALAVAGCGGAEAAPPLVVGAVEDAAEVDSRSRPRRWRTRSGAGFRAIVLSAVWTPPRTTADPPTRPRSRRARRAAVAHGIRADRSPSTRSARHAAHRRATARRSPPSPPRIARALPARARLDRRQRAEPQPLLAAAVRRRRRRRRRRPPTSSCSPTTYDALKQRPIPTLTVIGGALAPRGGDKPTRRRGRRTRRPRSSRDLGAAYRASGRTRPIMDMFSIHPYPENSSDPADARPSALDVDRDRRLREARRAARRGVRRHGSRIACRSSTASTASRRRSRAAKRALYTGTEPAMTSRSTSRRRRAYYAQAIALAACQPHVRDAALLPRQRRAAARRAADAASTTPTACRSRASAPSRGEPSTPKCRQLTLRVSEESRPVRRLHVLPGRAGVAAPAVEERAAAQGRVRRGGRGVRAAASSTCATYSTTGVRPETDFFLWKITERYEDLGELGAALNATPLAGWLETPYSYLATTKASQYTRARKRAEDHAEGLAVPRRLPVREGAALVRAPRG